MNLDNNDTSDKAPSNKLLWTAVTLGVVGTAGAVYNFFTRPSKKALEQKLGEVRSAVAVSPESISAQVSSQVSAQVSASERRMAEMIVSFEKRIGERLDKVNEAIIPSMQEAMEKGMEAEARRHARAAANAS